MNELVLAEHQILVQEGRFELVGYEDLKQQVNELGRYLLSIEVTPDNILESKRLVASVRKMVDNLNRERIDLKKKYLEPYNHLEEQVKDITDNVSEYEELVRVQIRELEEKERSEKKDEVRKLFELKRRAYGSEELYLFEDFIEPRHLNKSASLSKVEDEMAAWFEERRRTILTLTEWAEMKDLEVAEVINHFVMTNSMFKTMDYYNSLLESKEKVKQVVNDSNKKTLTKTGAVSYSRIKVREEDLERVKLLLEASGIEYTVI